MTHGEKRIRSERAKRFARASGFPKRSLSKMMFRCTNGWLFAQGLQDDF
jgi:hypothetical protein